jgi:glutamate dehydrogenase (NAD(P)+)
MFCIREAAKVVGVDLATATVAIQGYGNAGRFAHKLVQELFGSRVVAVSDSKGGILNANGLDLEAVSAHKRDTGSVIGLGEGCQEISNEELFALDVDVLIPAALEGVLTQENAGEVRAKIVAELANGPTTPEADQILAERGVFVIPDFLCNAGGVTVSYFEQVQNAYGYYWDEAMVYQRLDQKMTAAFEAVHQVAERYGVHNRLAAYVVAVARVAEACRLRGWV